MSDRDLLLLTPDFPPKKGGVARYLSNLSIFLQERMTVIAEQHPRWHEFDSSQPYPIYRMALQYNYLWPKWLKTFFYLRSVKSQYKTLLTSHVLPFGTAAMMSGMPYIVFVHGMDIRLAKQRARKYRLAKRVLRKARVVVANSEALRDELARDFGVGSLVVHPCIEHLEVMEDKQTESFKLLTVSRLVERKGHADVLTALDDLRRSTALRDFVYCIVGTGPMEGTLKSMTRELGLENHVQFLGEVSDETLMQQYAQADVFVMPVEDSPVDKEGFGFVFLEAATQKTPSITTRISGVDEAVIDGETGILVSSNDPTALASAIHRLAMDPDERERLGQAAYDRVQNKFLCKDQFSKILPYL